MDKNSGRHNKSTVLDLSPFFLFEAAGDSDGDLDHLNNHHDSMMMMMGMGMGMGMGAYENEDDAQSCSYDVWDAHHGDALSSHNNVTKGHDSHEVFKASANMVHQLDHHNIHYHHHGIVDDDDDDDDDDDGELCKDYYIKASKSREDYKCTSEIISTANSNSFRKSCVDSSEGKNLTDKERSRLFWETCLAS